MFYWGWKRFVAGKPKWVQKWRKADRHTRHLSFTRDIPGQSIWCWTACWTSQLCHRYGKENNVFWGSCFRTPHSSSLIYVFPNCQHHNQDHCSFVVNFEMDVFEFSNFIPLVKRLSWLFSIPFICIKILEWRELEDPETRERGEGNLGKEESSFLDMFNYECNRNNQTDRPNHRSAGLQTGFCGLRNMFRISQSSDPGAYQPVVVWGCYWNLIGSVRGCS